MKAPIHCPVCGDPLLNTFPPAEDLNNKVTKTCSRRINHNIVILVEDDEVTQLAIDIGNGLQAIWLFLLEAVWIQGIKKDKEVVILPFFEPDLSNYTRLVEKVKTYLVFS